MEPLEPKVKAALIQTYVCLALSGLLLASGLAVWAAFDPAAVKYFGAGAAIFGLLAQDRLRRFALLITPNTFVTSEFMTVFNKYKEIEPVARVLSLILAAGGILMGLVS